ncbi:hypothetical protein [Candidatus Phyllobacterium onerii]|uniref:hypothetical protein n=1 Tax=Candidatus Phyllobacterium onerii TaxID=3020828 RepID=UPI00232DAE28|nr:hypothetical protein [Phyllobacterium sp. IY22]
MTDGGKINQLRRMALGAPGPTGLLSGLGCDCLFSASSNRIQKVLKSFVILEELVATLHIIVKINVAASTLEHLGGRCGLSLFGHPFTLPKQ